MPNWFYYDDNGQKQGPANDAQIKVLVARNIIRRDTAMEDELGHKGKAGQLPGLFPPKPTPQNQQPAQQANQRPAQRAYQQPVPQAQQQPVPQAYQQPVPQAYQQPVPQANQQHAPQAYQQPVPQAYQQAYQQPYQQRNNPTIAARFCPSCGNPIVATAVVCPNCGSPVAQTSDKSRTTYILLALFLGGLGGIHNFYAKRTTPAIIQLILCICVIGIMIVPFWALFEMFTVKEDGEGKPFK